MGGQGKAGKGKAGKGRVGQGRTKQNINLPHYTDPSVGRAYISSFLINEVRFFQILRRKSLLPPCRCPIRQGVSLIVIISIRKVTSPQPFS